MMRGKTGRWRCWCSWLFWIEKSLDLKSVEGIRRNEKKGRCRGKKRKSRWKMALCRGLTMEYGCWIGRSWLDLGTTENAVGGLIRQILVISRLLGWDDFTCDTVPSCKTDLITRIAAAETCGRIQLGHTHSQRLFGCGNDASPTCGVRPMQAASSSTLYFKTYIPLHCTPLSPGFLSRISSSLLIQVLRRWEEFKTVFHHCFFLFLGALIVRMYKMTLWCAENRSN